MQRLIEQLEAEGWNGGPRTWVSPNRVHTVDIDGNSAIWGDLRHRVPFMDETFNEQQALDQINSIESGAPGTAQPWTHSLQIDWETPPPTSPNTTPPGLLQYMVNTQHEALISLGNMDHHYSGPTEDHDDYKRRAAVMGYEHEPVGDSRAAQLELPVTGARHGDKRIVPMTELVDLAKRLCAEDRDLNPASRELWTNDYPWAPAVFAAMDQVVDADGHNAAVEPSAHHAALIWQAVRHRRNTDQSYLRNWPTK